MPTMISDLEEQTLDLDWFAVDANGEIGHFATGGLGFLPLSVKACNENRVLLRSFFRGLAGNGEAIESPSLASHRHFASEAEKERSLEDFVQMSSKGLYSFDCIFDRKRPSGYYLVVLPSNPLTVEELPDEIRPALELTRFPGSFAKKDLFQGNEFRDERIERIPPAVQYRRQEK